MDKLRSGSRQAEWQTDRRGDQKSRQADRQTDRPGEIGMADKQTGRQTEQG
jgi:hypothetical protein